MKRAVIISRVCALLVISLLLCLAPSQMSVNDHPQTTLSKQEQVIIAEEIIYGKVNLTVDVWNDNPMKFYSRESTWNGYEWEAPLYWQLYWNGTGFDTPAPENQVRGGDLLFETDANSTIWVSMRPSLWAEDYYDFYSGPLLNLTGFATNAVVINTTYHQYEWNITAHIVPEHWNMDGWYFMGVSGCSFFKYNETHYFDGFLQDSRMFYFNRTEYIAPEPSEPTYVVGTTNWDNWSVVSYDDRDRTYILINPTTDNDLIGAILISPLEQAIVIGGILLIILLAIKLKEESE